MGSLAASQRAEARRTPRLRAPHAHPHVGGAALVARDQQVLAQEAEPPERQLLAVHLKRQLAPLVLVARAQRRLGGRAVRRREAEAQLLARLEVRVEFPVAVLRGAVIAGAPHLERRAHADRRAVAALLDRRSARAHERRPAAEQLPVQVRLLQRHALLERSERRLDSAAVAQRGHGRQIGIVKALVCRLPPK
eukprot:6076-Prymnesium_polylepis.1